LIKCAMFDCGNVLVQFDTERFYSFIKQHRTNCLEPHELFSGSQRHIIIDYDLDKLTDLDFFNRVKEAFGLKDVHFEDFFYLIEDTITVDREMLAIRDKLQKKGVATVIVSNMNRFHFNYLRLNYPEVISGYNYSMISCEEGVAKPDSESWIRPLDFLGLKGEECLFIDDIIENINVASNLGIKGWHYNVRDVRLTGNGRLKYERKKLSDFLDLIWSIGVLVPFS